MSEVPPTPLVAAGELLGWFGVSRSRLRAIVAHPTFPKPYAVLQVGAIWRTKDVADWAAKHRPPKPAFDEDDG